MNHSDVIGIRAAETAELPELEKLVSSQWLRAFGLWQAAAAKPGSHTYVAEQAEAFGFVTLGTADLSEETGEVFGLWINESYRRCGWGRKLLVRGLGFLKRRGFQFAQMYVNEHATPLQGLISGLDFEPTQGTRELNLESGTVTQIGYQLDLKDYF